MVATKEPIPSGGVGVGVWVKKREAAASPEKLHYKTLNTDLNLIFNLITNKSIAQIIKK